MYSKGLAQRGVCCWLFFCFLVGTCQSVFSRCQPFCVCDFLLPRRRTCYDRHRTHMDHHHHHRLSLCARIALVYTISSRGGGARPCHLRVCVCVAGDRVPV